MNLRAAFRRYFPRHIFPFSHLPRIYYGCAEQKTQLSEWLRYIVAIKTQRVYLGSYLQAMQVSPDRRLPMELALRKYLRQANFDTFRLLEIGSWVGASVLHWAKILEEEIPGRWEIHCVDGWQSFASQKDLKLGKDLYRMNKGLLNSKALKLFFHNLKVQGLESKVFVHRGPSRKILPLFKAELFDFLYVDGSHYFHDVQFDLQAAAPLLKNGGLFSGDDLEIQMKDCPDHLSQDVDDRDYILLPLSKRRFHPGVTKAVGEYFGRPISCYGGFWVVQKNSHEWHDFTVEQEALH